MQTFPKPEEYVCGTGGEVDDEREEDSAAPATSPIDRHIKAMISKLEIKYLKSTESRIGQKLDDINASLEERLKALRVHRNIRQDARDAEWKDKLVEYQEPVEALRASLREAEGERAEELKGLSSTKLVLERLIISWTDIVEQAHQDAGLTEFEARLEKFASIFENSVRPWVQYLQLIQTAAYSRPESCLRFQMPKLTFEGEDEQLALTHKNVDHICKMLDVPPEERASSVAGDESD